MHHQSVTRLDPRTPLVLDARRLPRAPGSMLTVAAEAAAPADLGVEMVGVPAGARLGLELRLESVTEGVLVSGEVTGPVEGECARCLRPVRRELAVPVRELYAYPESATDATTEPDEVGRVRDGLIDLEPAVRDAVVLALPSSPLCRDDCPGLCPECGAHWDDLPADHRHEALVDPRWAALTRLATTEPTTTETEE